MSNYEYSKNIVSGLVALSEVLIILASGGILFWLYIGWMPNLGIYFLVMILTSTIMTVAFHQAGLYDISAICDPMSHANKILGILAISFLSFLALAFALKISINFSRVWVFSWFILSAILIFLGRSLCCYMFWQLSKAGRFSRKIIIVGCGDQGEKFIERLKETNEPWINIVGIFDDRKDRIGPFYMGYPVLGTLNDLLSYTRKNHVDDIMITLPWSANSRIISIVNKLAELPVHIRLSSDLAGFLRSRFSYSSFADIPMLDLVEKPLNFWRYLPKLMLDKVLGITFLILLSPLMLIIALVIKIDSKGPVLFRQKRYGFNNAEFYMLKFRTMSNERASEEGVAQAIQNDPRVTRVGSFLRRTSLDELPQLLNVLGGTMSLIGPRPHAVEHNEKYAKIIDGYFARHRVKPGMTGWAQVKGFRGETDTLDKMKSRVEHDIYYIENWSLFFEAKILIMTVVVVVMQKNAY
jgi:Undecaprenyl-phosphate glucose phosphotransferase